MPENPHKQEEELIRDPKSLDGYRGLEQGILRHEEPNNVTLQEPVSINIGTEDEPKELFIGADLPADEAKDIVSLLKEFSDVFAWTYADMPGLDPIIVEHKIAIDPQITPKKQKQRRYKPELALAIKEEVDKLLKVKFIEVAHYPEWVTNIVPVIKKNGKVRVCNDYRDLNKASSKDDFPLPHIDLLMDNTAEFNRFSFMDGFSGYNQIRMAEEDKEKTTFTAPWGTFCDRVMPFGLKNAGATYQRAMVVLFHDMMHREIEVYEQPYVTAHGKSNISSIL
ncbi:hypothetical protein MLD38_034410 [Melastoma candidum]|uniref:Uncharacterized protein n=1 Tax=Melastoma candidum TaxID=119954 RepID=A0ACB9M9M0_9MYRT|nr:hypothetical protein MLD38_034410 [Melastoma candidum]